MLIHDTHKPTELAQKKTIALIWVMSTSILVPACVLNFLFVWFSKWVAFLKRLHLNWINKKCKEGGKLRRQIILLKRRQQFKPRGKKVLFFFKKKILKLMIFFSESTGKKDTFSGNKRSRKVVMMISECAYK